MKHLFNILLLTFSLPFLMNGQSARAYEKAGEKALAEKDFDSALTFFQTALENNKDNVDLNYKAGEAARLFNSYKLSEKYYSNVVKNKNIKNQYPLAIYWQALMKKQMGEYEEAQTLLETFLAQKNKKITPDYDFYATKELKAIEWALKAVKNETKDTVIHLEKTVNSIYSDFAPIEKDGILYFSSLRFKPKESGEEDRLQTKILSYDGGETPGKPLGKDINEGDKNTAHLAWSSDGKRVYFNVCEYVNEKNDIRCDLFYRDTDGVGYGKAVKLPDYINLKGFTSTQPTIAYDKGLKSDILYFVSDRPEGKGKLDIWYTTIGDNEHFSQPENLAYANTRGNDITPFFDANSNSMYYSSDGLEGLGGFDIYKTTKKNGLIWSQPEHTGIPLNSSYNDIYFSINKDATMAYLASNRPGSMFLDRNNETCCYDIYKIKLDKDSKLLKSKTTPIVVAKEKPIEPDFTKVTEVTMNTNKPMDIQIVTSSGAVIHVAGKDAKDKNNKKDTNSNENTHNDTNTTHSDGNNNSKSPNNNNNNNNPTSIPSASTTTINTEGMTMQGLLPMALYFDNDQPDSNTKATTTKKNYDDSYIKYYAQKNKYKEENGAAFPEEIRDVIFLKSDEFFDKTVKLNYEKLLAFSTLLYENLKNNNNNIEVFAKGYASPLAKNDYNKFLSQRRIASIINHFKTFRGGVLAPYLDSGQLKVTERPFGEETANKEVSDDEFDARASIYNIDAAKERRVQLEEIMITPK